MTREIFWATSLPNLNYQATGHARYYLDSDNLSQKMLRLFTIYGIGKLLINKRLFASEYLSQGYRH